MISTRFPVKIESHTRERVRPEPQPTPDVGMVWGQASQFSIVNPPPLSPEDGTLDTEDAGENGGFTIRLWPEEIWTERTYRLSPVWRKFNVARIAAEGSPETTIDVAVTTELLFPIRTRMMKYTGAGSYVEDTGGRPYEERVIHSYVLLRLPPPDADWEIVQWGREEGEWPPYRDEMSSPGKFVPSATWQTHFGSGNWTR